MKTWRDVLRFILSVGAFFLAVYLLNLMGGPTRDATDAAQASHLCTATPPHIARKLSENRSARCG